MLELFDQLFHWEPGEYLRHMVATRGRSSEVRRELGETCDWWLRVQIAAAALAAGVGAGFLAAFTAMLAAAIKAEGSCAAWLFVFAGLYGVAGLISASICLKSLCRAGSVRAYYSERVASEELYDKEDAT